MNSVAPVTDNVYYAFSSDITGPSGVRVGLHVFTTAVVPVVLCILHSDKHRGSKSA